MRDDAGTHGDFALEVLASREAAPALLLRDTLAGIEGLIRKFVVVADAQSTLIALWCAHTYVIEAFDCTAYLQITSATKRAGKTRLLEVLEALVARPWLTGRTSAAVLVRKTDAERPTLLLDESDAAFAGDKDYSEALRGILNSGYRRSGCASLCVGQGANLSYRNFKTFGAKAIAGIGELPSTIADRAIAIVLRRRKDSEPCARWRQRDGHADAAPLREALAAWATPAVVERLRQARPAVPPLHDDRKAEVIEPLLAIAEVAGGTWPTRARGAALEVAGATSEADLLVELLRDISNVLTTDAVTLVDGLLPTRELLGVLVATDDRPWAAWRNDKPITARALARLLAPLAIFPVSAGTLRGYRADAFIDAISRYLPHEPSTRKNTNRYSPQSMISTRQSPSALDGSPPVKQPQFHWAADGLTGRSPNLEKTATSSASIASSSTDIGTGAVGLRGRASTVQIAKPDEEIL